MASLRQRWELHPDVGADPIIVWMRRVRRDPLSVGIVRVSVRAGEGPPQLLLERTMRMRWRQPSHKWTLVDRLGRTWFPVNFRQSDDRRGRWLDIALQSVDTPTAEAAAAPPGWFLTTADSTPTPALTLSVARAGRTATPSSGALAGLAVHAFRAIVPAPGWSVSAEGLAAGVWMRAGAGVVAAVNGAGVVGKLRAGLQVTDDSTINAEALTVDVRGQDFSVGAQFPNRNLVPHSWVGAVAFFWLPASGTTLEDGETLTVRADA